LNVDDTTVSDWLLSTTRAVRKRLDLQRPVERQVIERCLELAIQAPSGSNRQGWQWLVVSDADKRAALADIYRKGADNYLYAAHNGANESGDVDNARVFDSAIYLAENLEKVPVHVIPCVQNHVAAGACGTAWAGLFGSIFPAVWSFQLALRARGLGSCITTLHLRHAEEAAALLGIPDDMLQVALLPVAYTLGTDFKTAKREPLAGITHWNQWN
jgi:nitroreductase